MRSLVVLSFLLFTLHSPAHAGGPRNIQPHQICAALMTSFEKYSRFQNANETTANVVSDLREFRWNLGAETVKPARHDLHVSSHNAKTSDYQKIAAELAGLDQDWTRPEAPNFSDEKLIVGLKLQGWKEVEAFEKDVRDHIAEINRFVNDPENGVIGLKEKQWYKTKTALIPAASGLMALALPLGGDLPIAAFVAAATATGILNDSIATLAYAFRSDSDHANATRSLQKLLSEGSANDWIFDSWSYDPTKALVDQTLKAGIRYGEKELINQDLFDSEGFVSRMRQPSKQKKIYQALRARSWVGFDRMVAIGEDGEPTMWFVLRASPKRPTYKQKSSARVSQPILGLKPAWIPALK